MKKARTRADHQKFIAIVRDPDVQLVAQTMAFEDTGNPYHAWEAIWLCITHKKEFPGWVLRYLAQCAERMKSDEAKKAGDLR